MKQEYTSEPQVDGDILLCDGRTALIMQSLEGGGLRLMKSYWIQDNRYHGNKGAWEAWQQVTMTLAEAKALREYMRGA